MQLDAGVCPAVRNQLEDIGLLGALAGRLDDDLQRSPVGQQSDASILSSGGQQSCSCSTTSMAIEHGIIAMFRNTASSTATARRGVLYLLYCVNA